MFSYLKGILEDIKNNYIVIDINGIGFKVYTSTHTIDQIPSLNQQVKVHTYLNIKEDAMDLYGFMEVDELRIFELLISVSGVGPKAALAILSTLSPMQISLAIVSSDENMLIKAPGVGKKIAQRIILELKDKIKSEDLSNFEAIDSGVEGNGHISEAVQALLALGYSISDASRAVQAVDSQYIELEDIIRQALKTLIKQ